MGEQNIALWGWDSTPGAERWRKIEVTAAGLLRIDLTAISLGDLGDVDLTGIAANDIIYWNAVAGEWQPIAMWVAAHAASHEVGGADVIDVGGLSGQLADDQHVKDAEVLAVAAALLHAARHELGGADVINVAGLSGQLADDQHVKDAEVLAVAAALLHEATHVAGGADDIDSALAIAAMANLTSTKIWQGNAGNRPVEVAMPAAATIVRKAADETVNNSAVLQNDDHLVLAVGADDVWFIIVVALVTTGATPDWKCSFAVPAGGAMKWEAWSAAPWDKVAGGSYAATGPLAAIPVGVQGIYIGGGTAGNVNFQWAQRVADPSDTKVLTNSFLIAWQIA